MTLAWGLLLACNRLPVPVIGAGPEGEPPAGFACPSGTSWAVAPPSAPPAAPGAEVHACLGGDGLPDGPQLELWPGGAVAAEGAWVGGRREGVWTTWNPDGSFRSRSTWAAGRQQGERLEVGLDGRLVRIEMMDGAAGALGSLPVGTPVPEWEGGRRVEGTRYAGDGSAPAGG